MNALKFLTVINANVWALVWTNTKLPASEYIWWASIVVSTLSFYMWDIFQDFQLMQPGSRNYLLRNELAYDSKLFYYVAAVINLFLRFAWILQLSPLGVFTNPLERSIVTTVLGIVEAFRRTLWNYFRIETEHLKYVGNFSTIQNLTWPLEEEGGTI